MSTWEVAAKKEEKKRSAQPVAGRARSKWLWCITKFRASCGTTGFQTLLKFRL